jgi:hypothetical protein
VAVLRAGNAAMNPLRSITRLWRSLRGQPLDEHEQQLMRLYWNRAELKKELSALQEERQSLNSKLDNHQAAVRRAAEQVDELAAYLGRPEAGTQGLLYFQLRSLWLGCARKLAQFVKELRVQQEERERRRQQTENEAQRATQVAALHERLLNAQSIAASLDARLKLLARKLSTLKWIWNYWRRRELQTEIAQVQGQWSVAASNETDLADEHAAIAGAALAEFSGLSVDGRRIVNTAAIAYAEWLIASLPHRSVAPLARHAISVQIFDATLGTAQECARHMDLVRVALEQLNAEHDLTVLKEPIERIRARAVYRSGQDTVPLSTSVGEMQLSASADDDSNPVKVNVLIDDYWSIAQVLLH